MYDHVYLYVFALFQHLHRNGLSRRDQSLLQPFLVVGESLRSSHIQGLELGAEPLQSVPS